MNLSAPFVCEFFKEPLEGVLGYCDYVIGNETEAGAYGEADKVGSGDVRKIARHIADKAKVNGKRKRVVIVTQGTEPTIVAVQGEEGVKEFPVHVVAKEEICDTTGAGYVRAMLIVLASDKECSPG